jgi:1-acyl-sn-glycerol-3-phosphate acyltransferase
MIFSIRCIVLFIYFLVVAILGIAVCLVRPFHPDNSSIVGRAFGWMGPRILGVTIKVENAELLDNMQPGVIVANHQSNLDLFILGGLVPRRTSSVGKSSLKYVPVFGQLYWLSGNLMIDRSNASKSIEALRTVSEAINKDQRTIWVFPEGTRSQGRGLGSFKKGAFHMAVQAQCPVYMVAVSSYFGHLNLNQWHSGTVMIRVLPPIQAKGLESGDVDELLQKAHATIASNVTEMDSKSDVLIVES